MNRGTGQGSPWDDEFARYVGARGRALRMTAYRLCHDWHHAEDITQQALITLYRVWPRLDNREAIDAYARQVVLRTYLNERRRPWRDRERSTDELPETTGAEPGSLEDQLLVRGALSAIAPKQQEVLVLRYGHDLSVEETAEELGLSTGTVKSQSARGLATLRKRLGPHFAVLAAAAATIAVIVAIVLGITAKPPAPMGPARPPETTTPSPTTTSETQPASSPVSTTPGSPQTTG